MTTQLRALVSQHKVRYTDTAEGLDLDLTYITPRIIAMAAPFEGLTAAIRNPFPEVERFFALRHPHGAARVYDLRAERGAAYAPSAFAGSTCGQHRFFDHNPPPLHMLAALVEDMAAWLAGDPLRVVAVHCKAGKGRTGLVVSALLLRLGLAPSAADALALFGEARTHDGKGVTIPSQLRYVHYYEALLRSPAAPPAPPTLRLRRLVMHTIPHFDVVGGCDPYFSVRQGDGRLEVYNWLTANGGKVANYKPRHADAAEFEVAADVRVRGDTKVCFFDQDLFSEHDKMFHFWFHTGYVHDLYLRFPCVPRPRGPVRLFRQANVLLTHPSAPHRRIHASSPTFLQQADAGRCREGQGVRALCARL